ncbi:MAG TPA: hypothetical protein VN455_01755 [Methanotrichaceae archaeon]|nr:hypothetical protein [Methanotrichaceae archaeon]
MKTPVDPRIKIATPTMVAMMPPPEWLAFLYHGIHGIRAPWAYETTNLCHDLVPGNIIPEYQACNGNDYDDQRYYGDCGIICKGGRLMHGIVFIPLKVSLL